MDLINMDIEYCYGIGKLKEEFDLQRSNGCIIYSQNGTMKTSFANTFDDLANGRKPTDRIYPHRNSKYDVLKEDDSQISDNEILVIKPYDEIKFSDYKDTSLLANEELRTRYLKVYKGIDEHKDILLKKLSKVSGIKRDIEQTICQLFNMDFYNTVEYINKQIQDFNSDKYESLPKYNDLFDEKAIKDLQSSVDISLLNDYMNKYNELLEKSKYLKKGVFNHTNANKIGQVLEINGFFQAQHSLNLNGADEKLMISTKDELDVLINEEKEAILNNQELKGLFNKIDAALTKNKNTEGLRTLLEDNPNIVSEYNVIESFKKNMWYTYFKLEKDSLNNFIEIYNEGKRDIEDIVTEAKSQETEWHEVLKIFKRRFSVPFDIKIGNKTDVLLSKVSPAIEFSYKDRGSGDEINVTENLLLECLSTGEKRALHILNIIFEIKRRELIGKDVLLIVDDIADSFDYKNKYAIIEYLRDIKNLGIFKMIILTHNFDFYRTVVNRLGFKREDTYMTIVEDEVIKIVQGQYTRNIFNIWKNELETDIRKLVASIPFVRNIVEYLEDTNNGISQNYEELTSLLHIKDRTLEITIEDLEKIFNEVWKVEKNLPNKDKTVISLILYEADKIYNETCESINLENKIILSIASRLCAEMYMINEILKVNGKIKFNGNQTPKLIEEYIKYYPTNIENIKILEDVNLMTAENIHLNSFMYEPILDMSDSHLKRIYSDAKELYSFSCDNELQLVAATID